MGFKCDGFALECYGLVPKCDELAELVPKYDEFVALFSALVSQSDELLLVISI